MNKLVGISPTLYDIGHENKIVVNLWTEGDVVI
jgi:hypothetical protein